MKWTYPQISPIHSYFPQEFPADLQSVYFLAKGQYNRPGSEFGMVLFRDRMAPFHHDPGHGMRSAAMIGLSKVFGSSMDEVISHVPHTALALGDRFYARDPHGSYFSCTATTSGTRVEAVKSKGLMVTVETHAQHQMARGLCQVMLEAKNIPSIIFLEKEFRDDFGPLFTFANIHDKWVLQNPELLGQIGFSASWSPQVTNDLVESMRQWPEDHVLSFFQNPRHYARDLRQHDLETLAQKLEPHQVPAIMRSGIIPYLAPGLPDHLKSETIKAFEREKRSLEEHLGSPADADLLMLYRRAHPSPEVTDKLAQMEAKLPANRIGNLPEIPNLTIPEGGFLIVEQDHQIGK